MVMTDTVADMFTRVRNASLVGKKEVVIPYSKFKEEIAKLLKGKGFVSGVKKFKEKGGSRQFLALENPKVSHIKRLSKPGQRWYVGWEEIRDPNAGFKIISTSRGIMDHEEARRKKLGGELIGEVW